MRQRFARALSSASRATTPERIGEFLLRPDQREMLGRIEKALVEFNGALVVDAPGTGKTILALAVASGRAPALVLAPASLRDQWTALAARANIVISFHSYERLSRGEAPPLEPALIIADEAHHLRNPSTRRYRLLTRLSERVPLLLLTATPIFNRPDEREALLALFLGARAAGLDAASASRAVLRGNPPSQTLPSVVHLAPREIPPEPPGLESAIRDLPPSVPLHDGAPADGFVRVSLAAAWASGLVVLEAALHRRVVRGRALEALLAEGRWPSVATIRRWTDPAASAQLDFAALFENSSADSSRWLEVVRSHIAGVMAARARIAAYTARDLQARASAIRELLASHPEARLVAIGRHRDLVDSLSRELRGLPGMACITGRAARAAHGRWSRAELLRKLGPAAERWRVDDPRGIRLLLATDLLSEGIELQGAELLLHLDPPWSPAVLEQRLGRLVRQGAIGTTVTEVSFRLPTGAERLLQMERRHRIKSRTIGRVASESAAIAALQRLGGSAERGGGPRVAIATSALVSGTGGTLRGVSAPTRSFVALVTDPPARILLSGILVGARWSLSERPSRVVVLLESAVESPVLSASAPLVEGGAVSEADPDSSDPGSVRRLKRLIRLWWRRRRAQEGISWRDVDGARRRLLRRLDEEWQRLPPQRQRALAETMTMVRARVSTPRSAGWERRLEELATAELSFEALLAALQRSDPTITPRRRQRPKLRALLILVPPEAPLAAPPSVSPESAGPRRSARARRPSRQAIPGSDVTAGSSRGPERSSRRPAG